jgi:hypothetical protein
MVSRQFSAISHSHLHKSLLTLQPINLEDNNVDDGKRYFQQSDRGLQVLGYPYMFDINKTDTCCPIFDGVCVCVCVRTHASLCARVVPQRPYVRLKRRVR